MKRLVYLLIPVVLLAGLLSLVFFHQIPASDPLELVPKDCVLMLDVADLSELTHEFFLSRFGQNLTSIDWPYVLEQLEVSARSREQFEKKIRAVSDCLTNPLCRKIFGGRVVFSLIPFDRSETAQTRNQRVVENVLMVATPRSTRIITALLTTVAWLKGQVHQIPYRGRIIQKLELDSGGFFYFALLDGHLVVSMGRLTIEKSIDLTLRHVVQEQTGLITNVSYTELRKRYRGDDFFLYTDLVRLTPFLSSELLTWPTYASKRDTDLSGFRRMALYHSTRKNRQQLISIIQFAPERLTPLQKTWSSRPPALNNRLAAIPSELVVYFWSNWLDLNGWWSKNVIQGSGNKISGLIKLELWLKERTGLDMGQFLLLFGQEFGLNVTRIRTSGFFPVPSILCYLELKNPGQVEEIIEKTLSGLILRRDKINGVPVVSVMIAQGLMQPSYAILGNFILLADSRQQLEELLTGRGKKLVDDAVFQAVDTGMTAPANLHFFASTSDIIDSLKELVLWGGSVLTVRDSKADNRRKIWIGQVVLPLLDGLRTFKAKSVRGYTAPGECVFDAVVLTEPVR